MIDLDFGTKFQLKPGVLAIAPDIIFAGIGIAAIWRVDQTYSLRIKINW